MDSPQMEKGTREKGWRVLTHDPMPKRSATPRIALMILIIERLGEPCAGFFLLDSPNRVFSDIVDLL